jgi:ABC-type multidrug transport system fused ATPase/permease subunit
VRHQLICHPQRDHFDGVTIIAVAHRIVTVRHFDRILVMANG